jgi:hypothetical protein
VARATGKKETTRAPHDDRPATSGFDGVRAAHDAAPAGRSTAGWPATRHAHRRKTHGAQPINNTKSAGGALLRPRSSEPARALGTGRLTTTRGSAPGFAFAARGAGKKLGGACLRCQAGTWWSLRGAQRRLHAGLAPELARWPLVCLASGALWGCRAPAGRARHGCLGVSRRPRLRRSAASASVLQVAPDFFSCWLSRSPRCATLAPLRHYSRS